MLVATASTPGYNAPQTNEPLMDTIVLCAAVRDAAPHILEWIAFHRLIGVDRFVLYDEGSTDGTAALIGRSRFGRQVTVIDWPQNQGPAAVYADFAANHAKRFTWAAIIDQDEFIHPLEADTIRALLPRYTGFAAVLLRRLSFGRSAPGRPGQLVIGACTRRVPDDSPLDTAAPTLLRAADFHGVQGTPPAFALTGDTCNARGDRVGPPEQACADVMVVNRYRRGVEAQATIPDRRITRFLPGLRAMLHDVSPTAAPRAETPVPPFAPPAAAAPAPAGAAFARLATTAPAPAAAAPAPAAAAPAPPTDADFATLAAAAPAPAAVAAPAPPAGTAPMPSPAVASAAPPDAASLLLGIGIVTYDRQSVLSETLDRVQRHTRHPRTIVAVADDGSTDGTLDMLRARQVRTVTGRNMGVAWNKNRALFLLSELLRCDVVILLEDDTYPSRDNWEAEWIQAAVRWGHANLAADWLREHFLSGVGTIEDPILSHRLTAQCAVFSREALLFGGYFDTRFRGYGHEHVEHTWRLLRMGYGGVDWSPDAKVAPQFKLLWGGISHHLVPSASGALEWQMERNRVLAQLLLGEYSYRAPYQNELEARQLRDEMRHSFPRAVL